MLPLGYNKILLTNNTNHPSSGENLGLLKNFGGRVQVGHCLGGKAGPTSPGWRRPACSGSGFHKALLSGGKWSPCRQRDPRDPSTCLLQGRAAAPHLLPTLPGAHQTLGLHVRRTQASGPNDRRRRGTWTNTPAHRFPQKASTETSEASPASALRPRWTRFGRAQNPASGVRPLRSVPCVGQIAPGPECQNRATAGPSAP